MQDIVMPDVDTENEDDVKLPDGSAVAALIATLRLGHPDAPGFGAMIVRWCDDGEEIEVQIAPLSDGSGGGAPVFVVSFPAPVDAHPDEHASDAASAIDEPPPGECPPRHDCGARTVASSRPSRRGRRTISRSR